MANKTKTPEAFPDPLVVLQVDQAQSGLTEADYRSTVTTAQAAHEQRKAEPFSFLDVLRASRQLAQLPEDDTILHRIEELEAIHFNPSGDPEGYRIGSASEDDQTLYIPGDKEMALFSAEHATAHVRDGKWKEQDDFVGALAIIAAQDFRTGALMPLGRQTGDPNWDEEHEFKDKMRKIITLQRCGHVAIHGCTRKVSDLLDHRSVDFQLGIGSKPSDSTREAAERILHAGHGLGLRGILNTRFWNVAESPYPHLERGADGSPKTTIFSAGLSKTTRSFAEKVMEEKGIKRPAIQIELASTVRPQIKSAKKKKTHNQAATAANVLHDFLGEVSNITKSE